MAKLYLLDTDIASYVINHRVAAVDQRFRRQPPSSVAISVVTRAELLYGLERVEKDHPLQAGVRLFLRVVRCLDWDAACADWYARIRHQLSISGKPIGELDTMIAAHAFAIDATLVTNNTRHYRRIRPLLQLENWVNE